ncbi:RNA methyltransferase [bacterium]|nr:RNA methyltransferase [bacterium]
MLSKSKLKQYQQLHSKKFRQKYGLFLVEGIKSCKELLNSKWPVDAILCRKDFDPQEHDIQLDRIEFIEEIEFDKISTLKTTQGIIVVAKIHRPEVENSEWTLALDAITDPGNLGTILRIADWYGIRTVICGEGSVDLYNSKVIQASMGSFLRVAVEYQNLYYYLKNKNVFAAVLDGQNIRSLPKQSGGVILIGNEADGISQDLLQSVRHTPITIPGGQKTESLNAAVATAICCERLLP